MLHLSVNVNALTLRQRPLLNRHVLAQAYIVSCNPIFTALHGMQTRSSDENSARLSLRPSVTRVDCDKTAERSVQLCISCKEHLA